MDLQEAFDSNAPAVTAEFDVSELGKTIQLIDIWVAGHDLDIFAIWDLQSVQLFTRCYVCIACVSSIQEIHHSKTCLSKANDVVYVVVLASVCICTS